MGRIRRPLYVIREFKPLGEEILHSKPTFESAPEEWKGGSSLGESSSKISGSERGDGDRYYVFEAETSRVRHGGLEQKATQACAWDFDQELYISGSTVVWTAGQQLIKRFSSSSPVIQAKWCRIDAMNDPLLCILHADSLETFTPSGEMNTVPLQYAVGSIWPVVNGLLLQRKAVPPLVSSWCAIPVQGTAVSTREREGTGYGIGSTMSPRVHGRRSGFMPAPVLPTPPASSIFHLQHPLEEPQGVQIEDSGKLKAFCDTEEQIIWTSGSFPYLVSYHTGREHHSIWEVKATPAATESFSFSRNQAVSTQSHAWESPGLFLQRVWMEKAGQPQANQVFVATDDDGVPVLCLVVKARQKLFALRLHNKKNSKDLTSNGQLDIAWTLEAVCAVPVVSMYLRPKDRNVFDIFLLTSSGSLSLYKGIHHLCDFFLSSKAIEQPSADDILSGTTLTARTVGHQNENDLLTISVVEIQNGVTDRINVVTSSGKVYRCSLGLKLYSAVTSSCLAACSDGLRPSLYRYLLKHFLEQEFPTAEAIYLPTSDGKPDRSWAAFSDLVMEIIRDMPSSRRPCPVTRIKEPESAWEFLLQSGLHKSNLLNQRYQHLPIFQKPLVLECLPLPGIGGMDTESEELPAYISVMVEILDVLHAVYEDCKLDTLRWRQSWQLAILLSHLAAASGELEFVDYYTRDFAPIVPSLPDMSKSLLKGTGRQPPSLFRWLENCLKHRVISCCEDLPPLVLKDAISMDWSRKVIGLYEILLGGKITGQQFPTTLRIAVTRGTNVTPEQRLVLAMVAENFGLSDLDRLPCGVSLPLRHALNTCRGAPPGDWPPPAYVLVGREDLASTCAHRFRIKNAVKSLEVPGVPDNSKNPIVEADDVFVAAPYMLRLRPISFEDASTDYPETGDPEGQGAGVISDGMDHMNTTKAQLRFGIDLRLNEVRHLLGSSKPVAVRTANSPDVSDPDVVAQQQAQLWQLAQRTTSLPFGRGAYTLASSQPLLTVLPIPKLVLAGRLPAQHDATVNLDANTGNISDLTSWPEFHNGAAAGLRLGPSQGKITRTWIVYNKPDELSYAHAGFLMALGLQRHLRVLAITDVYRYLQQEHEATTVGVLIGMAAAYCGTMDPAISKMLYIHIPTRHPPSFPELELPTLMQSAALMAVGLLYQGSAHRRTTEVLLAEIGRKPGGDNALDREGYALAAGLALGLVTLGHGNDAWGLSDLHIEDRLRHYMSGGSEPSADRQRRFDGTFYSGLANSVPSVSRNLEDSSQAGGQVMEGSIVNLDVTAPGATLALALMFLKTNNQMVAARLAIPDTHFSLEYVRPDFILLRVVARSLILWDNIQASEDWVMSQIPDIVTRAVGFIAQNGNSTPPSVDADMEALAQAHVNILAGACLSIGLRYAGTASPDAQELLHKYALYFLHEKRAAVAGGVSPQKRRIYVDRGTLETCLNVAILSLSVVMAGTGDLETFRLFRYLRRRNSSDGAINYGNHMTVSMAIGFLFLGGGLHTFGTSNGAVAALLIALYPRFPTTPNDHRCHLQAFRHLYVLATEARCVQTVDVDTGLPVFVPLEISVWEPGSHTETTISRTTPCILPERKSLKCVRVCGPRYWPQEISIAYSEQPWWQSEEGGDPFNGGLLYVKRKVGACSYADDPIGCRSLLLQALQKDSNVPKLETIGGEGRQMSKIDQLISTFSADASMLAFAQFVFKFSKNKVPSNFEDFCLQTLFECLSTDRPALLQTYLSLHTTVETLVDRAAGRGVSASGFCNESLCLYSLKMALIYCEATGLDDGALFGGEPLIQQTFLASLAKRVEDVLNTCYSATSGTDDSIFTQSMLPELVNYLDASQWPKVPKLDAEGTLIPGGLFLRTLFACYLRWYDIPTPGVFHSALSQIATALHMCNNNVSSSLPILALLLPGTSTQALIRISSRLPHFTVTR